MKTIDQAPVSLKLFCTALMCMAGLTYLFLVFSIYQDTAMKPSVIAEAYGFMEYMELTYQTKTYLPYYALHLIAPLALIFLFTAFSEKWKILAALVPFGLVVADIAAMWGVPYIHEMAFAYILWIAGTLLGLSFAALFALNLWGIWLQKPKAAEEAGQA